MGPVLLEHCRSLVDEYERKEAVRPTDTTRVFLSPVFAEPKHDGGTVVIFDIRQMNAFVNHSSHRLLGINASAKYHRVGHDWRSLGGDAYLDVPLHQSISHFLSFTDGEVTYTFTSLPFGVNAAPLVFTSILRSFALLLKALVYQDDLVIWAPSQPVCAAAVLHTATALQDHWLVIHHHKSQPKLTQSLP